MYENTTDPGYPPVRRSCRVLYILNILMLIIAAVRIFGGEGEAVNHDKVFFAEAGAVAENGDPVACRSGLTVTDDKDGAPVLEVDGSRMDLTRPHRRGGHE